MMSPRAALLLGVVYLARHHCRLRLVARPRRRLRSPCNDAAVRRVMQVAGFAVIVIGLGWPRISPLLHRHGDGRVSLPEAAHCAHALSLPTSGNRDDIRQSTLCLLNLQRAKAGLSPLHRNARLELASQRHSDDMAGRHFFAHENPDGIPPERRMARARYRARVVGENLAWGSESEATPEYIVVGWMNSPHHRDNILEPRFREIGIGVAAGAPRALIGQRAAIYTTDFGSGR
jgi:uncharacterized protein YkwD